MFSTFCNTQKKISKTTECLTFWTYHSIAQWMLRWKQRTVLKIRPLPAPTAKNILESSNSEFCNFFSMVFAMRMFLFSINSRAIYSSISASSFCMSVLTRSRNKVSNRFVSIGFPHLYKLIIRRISFLCMWNFPDNFFFKACKVTLKASST